MTLVWLLQGLRAARLRHGGDNISPLKTASVQPNCSCRRRKMWAPGATRALTNCRAVVLAGIVYPRRKAAEEGCHGQPALR